MVKFDEVNEKLVCYFSGHLDSSNVVKWEQHLLEKIRVSKLPVVFDMEKVPYISSGFLRICIQIAKEVGKENLTVIHTCQYVKKVFTVSGLDKQLKIK